MALKDMLKKDIGRSKGKAPKEPKVNKSGRATKLRARNLPVKRDINLATIGEKPIQAKLAIPATILIIIAAALLSKYFVVDRLIDMGRAQGEVSTIQSQINEGYARLDGAGDLTDEYAHYTYSAMTAEEMARTDRVDVLNLIQRVVLPQAMLSTWSIHENVLTLGLSQSSLQQINLLAQQLRDDPLVDFCTVTTASTTENRGSQDQPQQPGPGAVTGQILVYLNSKPEETEAEEAPTAAETPAEAADTAPAEGEEGNGQ